MKRDWKIIRAILLGEDTSTFEKKTVIEHCALCIDAGYLDARIYRGAGNDPEVIYVGEAPVTANGADVASVLANEEDLVAVLREMDAANVGHVSEIVFDMMRKKASARLRQ